MMAPVPGSGSCPAWMHTVEKRAPSGSFTSQCYHSASTRMARSRLPDAGARARWMDAPTAPGAPTSRALLLHSWAGRLFLVAASLKVALGLLRQADEPPPPPPPLNNATTPAPAGALRVFVV